MSDRCQCSTGYFFPHRKEKCALNQALKSVGLSKFETKQPEDEQISLTVNETSLINDLELTSCQQIKLEDANSSSAIIGVDDHNDFQDEVDDEIIISPYISRLNQPDGVCETWVVVHDEDIDMPNNYGTLEDAVDSTLENEIKDDACEESGREKSILLCTEGENGQKHEVQPDNRCKSRDKNQIYCVEVEDICIIGDIEEEIENDCYEKHKQSEAEYLEKLEADFLVIGTKEIQSIKESSCREEDVSQDSNDERQEQENGNKGLDEKTGNGDDELCKRKLSLDNLCEKKIENSFDTTEGKNKKLLNTKEGINRVTSEVVSVTKGTMVSALYEEVGCDRSTDKSLKIAANFKLPASKGSVRNDNGEGEEERERMNDKGEGEEERERMNDKGDGEEERKEGNESPDHQQLELFFSSSSSSSSVALIRTSTAKDITVISASTYDDNDDTKYDSNSDVNTETNNVENTDIDNDIKKRNFYQKQYEEIKLFAEDEEDEEKKEKEKEKEDKKEDEMEDEEKKEEEKKKSAMKEKMEEDKEQIKIDMFIQDSIDENEDGNSSDDEIKENKKRNNKMCTCVTVHYFPHRVGKCAKRQIEMGVRGVGINLLEGLTATVGNSLPDSQNVSDWEKSNETGYDCIDPLRGRERVARNCKPMEDGFGISAKEGTGIDAGTGTKRGTKRGTGVGIVRDGWMERGRGLEWEWERERENVNENEIKNLKENDNENDNVNEKIIMLSTKVETKSETNIKSKSKSKTKAKTNVKR